MAHRGRLSVLAHNLGRSVESILAEFEGAKAIDAVKAITAMPHGGTGDVKYHHGAEGLFETRDGDQVKMRLYPNPSHLEFVDPVVEGGARAAQTEHSGPKPAPRPERRGAGAAARRRRLPRPGRGRRDAQPAVARRLLDRRHDPHHHRQPGRLHDRPRPRAARPPTPPTWRRASTCPIIHVNADDVEACIAAIRLAMAYREKWGRDVVIDLIGYRRYGHNETDEPAYTQPQMAATIKEHPPVSELYAEQLVKEGVVTAEEVERRGQASGARSSQATLKELRGEDRGRRVRGPELDRDRHRRARPHEEPRRSRRRSPRSACGP